MMAFFESLDKKAGEIAHSAVMKCKELAETTRINISMSNEEESLKQTYAQIGAIYCKEYADIAEGELRSLADRIEAINERIDELKAQMAQTKAAYSAAPIECPAEESTT